MAVALPVLAVLVAAVVVVLLVQQTPVAAVAVVLPALPLVAPASLSFARSSAVAQRVLQRVVVRRRRTRVMVRMV